MVYFSVVVLPPQGDSFAHLGTWVAAVSGAFLSLILKRICVLRGRPKAGRAFHGGGQGLEGLCLGWMFLGWEKVQKVKGKGEIGAYFCASSLSKNSAS